MNVTVEDVKKYLNLADELTGLAVAVLPDGKAKEFAVKAKALLEKDVLVEAVVVGFKLYDEVKVLVNSK